MVILTIVLLTISFIFTIGLFRLVWLFCKTCGEIENRDWYDRL